MQTIMSSVSGCNEMILHWEHASREAASGRIIEFQPETQANDCLYMHVGLCSPNTA